MKSVIDALAKSASHRRETSMFKENESGLTIHEELAAILAVETSDNTDQSSPEDVILAWECEREDREVAVSTYNALFGAIEGDVELEEVLDLVINGCELKPRYLAEKLNVPVDNINNRLKRLRRKAMSIKEIQ